MKKRELSGLIYFVFFVGVFSFIIIPFSGDVEVFLGGSRLADYYGKGLIYNSFNVWDVKGVFTRLFFYTGYSLVSLFASCPSAVFSIIFSLLYAGMVIILAWFIACNAVSNKNDRVLFIALFGIAFFTVDCWSKMQAEMTCTLLLFISLVLIMKNGGHKFLRLITGGILISFLFWFKIPLLLLSVCFSSGFLLLSEEKLKDSIMKLFIVAVGAVSSLLVIGIFVNFVNPDEYSRMFMTSIYQNTLLSGSDFSMVSVVRKFITGFVKAMITIPVLYIGTACLIINFVRTIQKKEYAKVTCHFVMWIIPMLYVTLSNCYFIYHYLTFMFSAMLEIWIFLGKKLDVFRKKLHTFVMLFICVGEVFFSSILSNVSENIVFYKHIDLVFAFIGGLLLVILFVICFLRGNKKQYIIKVICGYIFIIYLAYSSLFGSNSLMYIKLTNSSYKNDFSLPLKKNEKILYLDGGFGAYYFGYDTYYEEFFPLILQRIDENSKRSELQRYVDASQKILSYNGNYICLTEEFIFPNGKNPTLKRKIESQYEIYKQYNIYYPPESIFSLQTEESMHRLDIYKRRND